MLVRQSHPEVETDEDSELEQCESETSKRMNIAIVGCGYVADFYMASLHYYPELRLVGVYGRDAERLRAFGNYYAVPTYESLEELVGDPSVEVVLNLTNPRSHYEVTTLCLKAGRHVYSEKPLAMEYESAKMLVRIAKENDVQLSSAPCSVLGETAQTIWKALREEVIGPVRLVYANFDTGMTSRYKPWEWRSASGAPWPAKDEFEVGCAYEHAGYILTWLAAFFGPARRVTAFASCQMSEKGIPVDAMAPDFTVGCIEYADGIVARLTCSILAPKDKSLTIIGEQGVLYTKDMRNDTSAVYVRRTPPRRLEMALEYRLDYWRDRAERWFNWIPWSWGNNWRLHRKYAFAQKPLRRSSSRYKPVDFCRGPAEMAEAIRENRPCRLSGELGTHITELIEALQYPEKFGGRREIESAFDPIQPLPWDNRKEARA